MTDLLVNLAWKNFIKEWIKLTEKNKYKKIKVLLTQKIGIIKLLYQTNLKLLRVKT